MLGPMASLATGFCPGLQYQTYCGLELHFNPKPVVCTSNSPASLYQGAHLPGMLRLQQVVSETMQDSWRQFSSSLHSTF